MAADRDRPGEADEQQGDQDGTERQGVDPEDEGVVLAEEQQAGHGGPDDPAQVVLGRRQRDGTEQVLGGHQVGHHGLVGRKADGPRRPAQERQDDQRPGRVVVEAGQYRQHCGERRLSQGGEDQPASTVEPIGQCAAHRRQQADGDEARRRHQPGPSRPGRSGVGVDEDTERHRLHPRAQVGDQAGRPDEGEVPRAERAERCQGHTSRLPAPDRTPDGPPLRRETAWVGQS